MSLEKLKKTIPEAIEAISTNACRFNEKLQKIRKNPFVKAGEKAGIVGLAILGLNMLKAPITDKALELSFWSSNNNCNNPTQTENIKKRCENWDKLKKEYIASDGTVVKYYELQNVPSIYQFDTQQDLERKIANATSGRVEYIFPGIDGVNSMSGTGGVNPTLGMMKANFGVFSKTVVIDYAGIKNWSKEDIEKYAKAVYEFIQQDKGNGELPNDLYAKYIVSTSFGSEFVSLMPKNPNNNIQNLAINPFVGEDAVIKEFSSYQIWQVIKTSKLIENRPQYVDLPADLLLKTVFAPDQYGDLLKIPNDKTTVIFSDNDGITGGAEKIKEVFPEDRLIRTRDFHTEIDPFEANIPILSKTGKIEYKSVPTNPWVKIFATQIIELRKEGITPEIDKRIKEKLNSQYDSNQPTLNSLLGL